MRSGEGEETQPLLGHEHPQEQDNVMTERKTLTPVQYVMFTFVVAAFSAAAIIESKVSPLYIFQYLSSDGINSSNNKTGVVTGGQNASSGNTTTNGCGDTKSVSNDHKVQSEEALWMWYFSITDYSIVFFIMIGMGCCSDHFGRKPFLIISILGHGVNYLAKAYIIYKDLAISYFLILSVIGGLTSSNLFNIACMTIVADTTKADKSRSVGVAAIDMAKGLGYVVTQLLSGYLTEKTGYIFPCLISGGLCVLCAIITCVFIPETLSSKNNAPEYKIKESFKNLIGFYHNKKYLKPHATTKRFIFVVLILVVYAFRSSSVSTVYVIGPPFCWSAEALAWHSFASETMHLLLNVPILKLLHLCIHDAVAGLLGFVSIISAEVIYGLATETWMLYLATGTGILSAIPLTVIKALLSRMVHDNFQGALFANIYIITILCAMGSSSVFNNVYSASQDFFPGLMYLVVAGVSTLTAIMFIPLIFINREVEKDNLEDKIHPDTREAITRVFSTNSMRDVDGQAHMYLSEQTEV